MPNKEQKMKGRQRLFLLGVIALCAFLPEVGFATVESTLQAFQTRLIGTVLPLAAILGLVCATLSFFFGEAPMQSSM